MLRVLHEAGVPIDLIVGTSVGALVGGKYAANPDIFELEWMAQRVTKDDIFDFSFLSGSMGPVQGDALVEFVEDNFKESRIEKFPIPFVAVAADLQTGKKVLFKEGGSVELSAHLLVSPVYFGQPFTTAGCLSTAVWSRIFLYPQPMNSAQILYWHQALPKACMRPT